MKKFLSLVLALVMTMSLVTVSAGAKDFTDDGKITYEEAVNVISTIGVVDGYTDGSFNPQGSLTRGAAAKIICNMILGPTTAAELSADTAPYKDVPVNHTFAGYIAYCAKEGIISGYADGTFRPAGTLTGYAFMKMLLGALGYDAEVEQYTGANWSINVAKQAINIGLNKGLEGEFNGVKAVNREEAALYAFNTLQADLVEYSNKTQVTVGGAAVVIAGSEVKAQKWNNSATKIENIKEDDYIQFAEQYFTKLKKVAAEDDFLRPSHTWTYNKKELGTYVNKDQLVASYTEKVTGKDLYDLLGATTIRDNDLFYYVDGDDSTVDDIAKTELVRSNKSKVGETGDGVLTEVYVNADKELTTIVSINTWLAQATADYSDKTETVSLKIYDGTTGSKTAGYKTTSVTKIVDVEDVPAIADLEKDEFVLVNISKKENDKGDVVVVSKPEILSDVTVTKFTKDAKDDSSNSGSNNQAVVTSLTTSGTKYDCAEKSFYDASVLDEYNASLLTNSTYNVYLDQYGYAIGVELYEGTKNYVFITGYDRSRSNLGIKTADAGAIFLDGTMDVIKVNVTDTDKNIDKATNTKYFPVGSKWALNTEGTPTLNRWFTYTVDKNGVYTLKPVNSQLATAYADITDQTINCNHVKLVDILSESKPAYGEDASIYITVDQGLVDTTSGKKIAITEVTGTYTGVQDVKLVVKNPVSDAANQQYANPVYTVFDGDNYVIASIVIGEAQGSTANYAYILSGAKSEGSDADGNYYWEFQAVLGGEIKTLTIKSKYSSTVEDLDPKTVQNLRFDGDYVVAIDDVDDNKIVKSVATQINEKVHEVYDVTTPNGLGSNYQKIPADALPDDTVSNREAVDLYLSGRTLYTGTTGDKGLTFVRDAKAVLIQTENKKQIEREYASVEEALGALADAKTGNGNDGLQFRGRIVAVLNNYGVAEYVVIISSTAVKSGKDPNYGSTTSEVRVKDIDTIIPTITLDTRDQAKGSVANIEAAARQALASVGYRATAGVDTTATPNWTITAVDMNTSNPAAFTFSIVWG